ncbi:hypothetical protein D910_07170 [Dendroctonus ponderosae]|uniref:DUF5641 domain-containing protein n=1 Tax=Dendroctonus ponderosae TaxID=77166 RepID=U4U7C8_DENPD|nr:hypothetical protein D910_07170 [Dendroctonus ponderosae]
MFWAQNTRVPIVSDNITRNRFFKLRSRLKVVDDNMISAEEKSHDRFWKVRPLLDSVFVFTDRYFTSIPLIDFLFSRKVFLAGTIMANRIPKNAGISSDNDLKKKKRGSYDQLVRDDGKISLVKWFDNKPVNLASSCMGVEPEAAGWLEYRENAKAAGLPRKEIMDFLDFKLSIAKSLILENQGEDDMEFEAEDDEQPGSKRRSVQPIPDKRCRRQGNIHLMEFMKDKQKSRSKCRLPNCNKLTFAKCKACAWKEIVLQLSINNFPFRLFQSFWNRWNLEYFHSLQERSKWKFKKNNPSLLGSLVLLKEEAVQPLHWPMARIIAVYGVLVTTVQCE